MHSILRKNTADKYLYLCHLPLDDFVIDLEHLLSCRQSKVPEPVSSSQTLVAHVLEVVVQGVTMDMKERPRSGTEEHVLLLSVELTQFVQHVFKLIAQRHLVLPACLHALRRNRPQVFLQVELLPSSRSE